MAREINWLDVDRKSFETFEYIRAEVDDQLRNKIVINIETKKYLIRFWYNNEK